MHEYLHVGADVRVNVNVWTCMCMMYTCVHAQVCEHVCVCTYVLDQGQAELALR